MSAFDPTAWGLVKVAEHELSEPFYSFDTLACWRGAEGLYIATDSGCSCPIPFENYGSIDELTGPLTLEQALEESSSLKGKSTYDLEGFNDYLAAIRGSKVTGA